MPSTSVEVDEGTDAYARAIQLLKGTARYFSRLFVSVTPEGVLVEGFPPKQSRPMLQIDFFDEQDHSRYDPTHDQLLTAVGEVLEENHPQLTSFEFQDIVDFENPYPLLWRGLASNRVLKEITFVNLFVEDHPISAEFLTNRALESFYAESCRFNGSAFSAFCERFKSSQLKNLQVSNAFSFEVNCWSSFWSALQNGPPCLERLIISRVLADHEILPGFEAFLTNNTTVQELWLDDVYGWGYDRAFIGALGRSVACNTTLKRVKLCLSDEFDGGTAETEARMVQALFAEGLVKNTSIDSLLFGFKKGVSTVTALVDGLEQMMRRRAMTNIGAANSETDPRSILRELYMEVGSDGPEDGPTVSAIECALDRLVQTNDFSVQKLVLKHWFRSAAFSPRVADLVRKTDVLQSVQVWCRDGPPDDTAFVDLADAAATRDSLVEVTAGGVEFRRVTDLLPFPNRSRIRYVCRRNEINFDTIKSDIDQKFLPVALSQFLGDGSTSGEVEGPNLVGRSFAFELLKVNPDVFASLGKRKRDD